ncbi:CHAT domain-containing protein [Catellatospora sp. TT07R-123]|uniref:CHAT domain-containing protein n=1 Tax=Catellatospora sp. TT07R-123 TaxID=2733863 RepID=UPI001BB3F8C2|nr:CHAT domain-containing protein [Catellatospora sp. TT07R-123]
MTVQAQADDGFGAAAAEVLGLPDDDPDRPRRAAQLIIEIVGQRAPLSASRHLEGLLAAAAVRPPRTPQWPRVDFVARIKSEMYKIAEGPAAEHEAVDARLRSAEAEAGADPTMRALVQSARLALDVRRAADRGDESFLLRLPQLAQGLIASLPDQSGLAGLSDFLSLAAEGAAAHRRGDIATAWTTFQQVEKAAEGLSIDPSIRESLRGAAATGAALKSVLDDGVRDDHLAMFAALLDRPGVDRHLAGLGLDMVRIGDPGLDRERIGQGITHLRDGLSVLPDDDPGRPMHLVGLALGLFRHSEATGTTDGLGEARTLLIEARELLHGPHDPRWPMTNGLLAEIEQRLGAYTGVAEAALDGQRGHAWRAMLAHDVDEARDAIRDAADSALSGARQCLSTGKLAEALRLLDTGRGLTLFAAVEQHRIPTRLSDAGRDDLAAQWNERGGLLSEQARRQALEVLTEQGTPELFDPPRLVSIQQALRLLDADALVYLVPGEPPRGGLAVMAPAQGPPAFMALPNLNLAEGTEGARYLMTLSSRNARETDPEPGREIRPPQSGGGFADSLADLCHWAWGAAMGPVLESYLPRLALPDHRVPRIVLIPMGDLGRVPWHAARRKDGVYAVELAAVSQAVSARMMCDNAVRAPVPIGSTGLVVGDPQTGHRARSLRSARAEAYTIREAFYRGARYLGRLPDTGSGTERTSASGPGTAGQVRDWLVSRSPAAGTMLHLACHGIFRPDPEPAGYLLLGDGSELSVDELVDLLATAPDREISMVVLAACNSGRAVSGYDEAYSLGTGFLAGGVRSVLSTQWSIPDAATSWLMYLFHHNLRTVGMPPWQALRQAQLWMLDPARTPPPGMPAGLVPGPGDHPEEPVNWAGFVHYGQ